MQLEGETLESHRNIENWDGNDGSEILADNLIRYRSTFPRPAAPTARAKTAKSTLNTKSHNTKPAK
jgi:hypothetical protein